MPVVGQIGMLHQQNQQFQQVSGKITVVSRDNQTTAHILIQNVLRRVSQFLRAGRFIN